MDNRSDVQLIQAYLKGEEKAFEFLIERYFKQIYSFSFRYIGNAQDAEDITQETFIKAWRNLKKYDLGKSFKTWLFSIARNTCIDFLRKKKSIPFSLFERENGENALLETLADSSPLPDEMFERKGLGESLGKAMGLLPPKYRSILFLRYNDHFTFREISEIFREPIDTIKSRHRRALILLKKLFT
jgi:RNA polymerase sigma-70 factor (ECF subfamily)